MVNSIRGLVSVLSFCLSSLSTILPWFPLRRFLPSLLKGATLSLLVANSALIWPLEAIH